MGSMLCVMGGQLWFLGHAYFSYMSTGSALDVMDYGLAEAIGLSNKITARMLLILHIIALGNYYNNFLPQIQASCINMHFITFIQIHKCFLRSRAL